MIDLTKWTRVGWEDRLERIPADFSEPQEMTGYIPEPISDEEMEKVYQAHEEDPTIPW